MFFVILPLLSGYSQVSKITEVNEDLLLQTEYDWERRNYSSFLGNNDTLYSFLIHSQYYGPPGIIVYATKSSDYGNSWSNVEKIYTSFSTLVDSHSKGAAKLIQLSDDSFLGMFLSTDNSDNILMCIKSENLNVFDSVKVITKQVTNFELSEGTNGSIYLTYRNKVNDMQFRKSDDKGFTWNTTENIALDVSPNSSSMVQAFDAHHLILAFARESSEGTEIFTIESFDEGKTWVGEKLIFTDSKDLRNIHLNKSIDGTLWIIYQQTNHSDIFNIAQEDVYIIKSVDYGNSWSDPERFTNFVGQDEIVDVTNTDNGPFISLRSNRIKSNENSFHFGIGGESRDPSPPVIHEIDHEDFSIGANNIIQIKAEDDKEIQSVFLTLNNNEYSLYDDGLHGDEAASDNIFGNFITNFDFNDLTKESFINLNNIYLPFNNRGVLADANVNIDIKGNATDYDKNQANMDLIHRSGNSRAWFNNEIFLFSGGFYLSGYQHDNLWTNAVASASLVEDYLPGTIGSDPEGSHNQIYTVLESDPPFGQSWQEWVTAVEQGAYFYDGDGDGIYNPIDKNNNGLWDTNEDKPDILYDANYFTVYNDAVPKEQRRWNTVDPVGIEIRQSVFASTRNTLLQDVVFVRYSLLYKGLGDPSEPDSLTDVIFSIWNDVDLGGGTGYTDDLVGCDTTLEAGYVYNDGEDEDWGVNPPAIFKVFVQGPIAKSNNPDDVGYNRMGPELGEETYPGYKNIGINAFMSFIGGEPSLPDPNNAEQARFNMLGKNFFGDYLDPCDWAFGDVLGNVDCSNVDPVLWYSGDPVTSTGWIYNAPNDIRDLSSTGQFTLVKNQPMDIIVAYVVGQGTDHLNSITRARETTQYVHEEYERNFSTIVGVEDQPEELVNNYYLSQNYPNPFNPSTVIKFNIASVAKQSVKTSLVVYDILGRKVKTLVNEVKAPGTYEIEFDASQFASGVYFYRLTSGDFVQTKKMMVLK